MFTAMVEDPRRGYLKFRQLLMMSLVYIMVNILQQLRLYTMYRAHSFGQFKKHALLKARTQSPCFSYPGLARAFISAGSADLLSFGGDSVSLMSGAQFTVQYYSTVHIYSRLPVYERAKMRPVYLLIVALTDFLSIFCIK